MKDKLTGILSNGEIRERVERSLRSMKQKDACVLFMIDIDNFSEVYNTFGEAAGEKVLLRTGEILSSVFGTKALTGRIGGDEFLAFWSGTVTDDTVSEKAKRIREAFPLIVEESQSLEVTVSVGACLAAGEGLKFENLYRGAEKALSKAKKIRKTDFL